ncbi:MAG: ketopantoate reductase family protein, partial [Chloroflexi bacterium]|nr:ketopantoate reductase family protein [Chloroflexota bacterium]
MNILVYGAGVLGSLYAARLQEAGQTVSVLARGKRLAALREDGIVLEEAFSGRRTVTSVNVVERLDPDDAYDLIIVLVRKNQVESVLPALAANRRTPNILFMHNNAAGPDELVAAVGRERVLLGFPGAGGSMDGQVVRYAISPGAVQPTTLGELDGTTIPRLQEIAAAFKAAGFPVAISPNMEAWLLTHAAWISPLENAIASAGGDNYRLAKMRDRVGLMVRAI